MKCALPGKTGPGQGVEAEMKELDLVNEIRRRAGGSSGALKLGIGDDCAVLDYKSGRYLLWAADMLVEGTHFLRRMAGYREIGRKAVAVNISDIAAMGGNPEYITVSIGVRPDMTRADIMKLYDGIFGICREFNVSVAGGDTNLSDKLVIDVSILGTVDKKRLVTRSGARPGDLIMVTGPVRDGKACHLDFTPRLAESRFIAGRYRPTAMIDVSDGLAPDLGRICAESGVGCVLRETAIPLSEGLSLDDALYYGESFELLFTMPRPESERMIRGRKRHKALCGFFVAGEITEKHRGMSLVKKNGRITRLKMKGFRHL
ncbi:MAG: thiamine-phosphate kinase [Candidatus Omnitrophota bacterium]